MIVGFSILLVVHGLIHLLGTVKAFKWADLPQLTQTISPAFGVLWFTAALLFLITAVAVSVWPRIWWAIATAAVLLSMIVIVPSWADAKFGAAANLIVLIGVVFGFLAQGPTSLRARYARDVAGRISSPVRTAPVTDADLAHLPSPVQRYLRQAGVVGQPPVANFRARMHGRIRSSRNGRWMSFTSEQHNVLHPAARLFYLNASILGIPAQGYHRYVDSAAEMRVKAAALVTVVSADGLEMTRSETVTLFNDLCLMAPAALIDPSIAWMPIDARTVRARFTNAGHTIEAELTFSESGQLASFSSDDRYQISPDGTMMRLVRWSTPIDGYRSFGRMRLASGGSGRWHEAGGDYDYIQLAIDEIAYNVAGP